MVFLKFIFWFLEGKNCFVFFFNCLTSYCLSYKIVLTSNFLKLKPRIRYLIPRRGQARKRLVKCSSEKGGRVERGVRSVTDCEQSIEITHYLRTSRKACSPPAVLKAQVFIHFYLTVIFQLAFIKYNICNMNNMHPLTRPSGPIYKKITEICLMKRTKSTAEHPGKETCKISNSSLGRVSVPLVGGGSAVQSALTSFVCLPHVTLEPAQRGLEKTVSWSR